MCLNKVKKSAVKVFIALFTAFLFLPGFTNAELGGGAYTEYNWASKTSITSSDNIFKVGGESIDADYAIEFNSADYYLMVATKATTYTVDAGAYGKTTQKYYKIIAIEKSNPSQGILIEQTGSSAPTRTTIGIGDPKNVGPKALSRVTEGVITGKVFQLDPNEWKSDFETNVVGKEVVLYTDEGTKVPFTENGSGRKIYKEEDNYYYWGFTLAKANNGKGLYPGRYRIKFFRSEGADCATGNAQAGLNVSQLACKAFFEGVVNFDIIADGTNGQGKIKLVNKDPEEMTGWRADSERDLGLITKDDGVNIGITYKLSSPLDAALAKMIEWAAGLIQKALSWSMEWVDDLLQNTKDYVLAGNIQEAWTKMRDIGLTLLVLALMIIAFANVLQIDIERYGLNRMIPKIIIAIIMSYFSWLIVMFFFDFTGAIQAQAMGIMTSIAGQNSLKNLGVSVAQPEGIDIAAKFAAWLLLLLIAIGVVIAAVVLFFMLLLRIVYLSFLLAVAPLAFIFSIMPFSEGLYKRWWSEFWKWMFMGPIAIVIIALGVVIASSNGGGLGEMGPDALDAGIQGGAVLINALILAAALYMAATLPLQWGGSIMKGWSNIGKKAWGKTGGKVVDGGKALAGSAGKAAWGKTGIPGAKKIIGDRLKQRSADSEARAGNRLARALTGGRLGTEVEVIKRQQEDAIVSEAGKRIGVSASNKAVLAKSFNRTNNKWEKKAIEREMANRGSFEILFAPENAIDEVTGGFKETDTGYYDGMARAMLAKEGKTNYTEAEFKDYQSKAKDKVEADAKAAAGLHLAELKGSDTTLEKTVTDNQAELAIAAARTGSTYGKSLANGVMSGQKGKEGHAKRSQILEELAANYREIEGRVPASDAERATNEAERKAILGQIADMVSAGDLAQVYGPKGNKKSRDNYTKFWTKNHDILEQAGSVDNKFAGPMTETIQVFKEKTSPPTTQNVGMNDVKPPSADDWNI